MLISMTNCYNLIIQLSTELIMIRLWMSVVASFELFSFQPEKMHEVDQNTCNKLKHKKTFNHWIFSNTFLPVG